MTKFAEILKLEETVRNGRLTGFEHGLSDQHYAQRVSANKKNRARLTALIMSLGAQELIDFHAYRTARI